jgi:hypothetical protein
MLRHVALVRTDVLEELCTSIIKVTRCGELGTTLGLSSNRCTLQRNTYAYICIHIHIQINILRSMRVNEKNHCLK